MKKLTLMISAAACMSLATAAFAQSLPEFNADAGYRVRAVLSAQSLLLDNDGTDFICEIEYQADRATITNCLPLLVEDSGTAEMQDAPDLAGRVAETTALLETLDPAFTGMAISSYFQENNCRGDISNMRAFEEILIQYIAESYDIDADVIPHVHDPIYDSIDDAMELLMIEGKVTLGSDGDTVLFDGCN